MARVARPVVVSYNAEAPPLPMTKKRASNHWITEFLEYLEIERGRSAATLRNYGFYLERFFSWARSKRKTFDVGAIDAVTGRDDPSARTMAQQLCRQALDLLAQQTGGFIAVWLRDLWDHTERLTRSLELAGAAPPAIDPRPLLDALLRGDREAALLALQDEQKRFADAVAQTHPPADRRSRVEGVGVDAFIEIHGTVGPMRPLVLRTHDEFVAHRDVSFTCRCGR